MINTIYLPLYPLDYLSSPLQILSIQIFSRPFGRITYVFVPAPLLIAHLVLDRDATRSTRSNQIPSPGGSPLSGTGGGRRSPHCASPSEASRDRSESRDRIGPSGAGIRGGAQFPGARGIPGHAPGRCCLLSLSLCPAMSCGASQAGRECT